MTDIQLIDSFVEAWARAEGFYDQRKGIPSISQRLNNPCNLPHWCDRNFQPYPQICGVVEFPDLETGWAAAKSQARTNILKRRLTFFEFFAGKPMVYRGHCPRDDMRRFNPAEYARRVARAMPGRPGIDVVVATLVSGNVPKQSVRRLAA